MTHKELAACVDKAIKELYAEDPFLITGKLEWATAHRLAVYLEKYLAEINPEWHVDCEYYRMEKKKDPKCNSAGKNVRPDIVIHKRGETARESNLLVIEIKMKSGQGADEEKLMDFTSLPNQKRLYQYQYGLKISFDPSIELNWFREGKEISV